jgi:hypothetical protein
MASTVAKRKRVLAGCLLISASDNTEGEDKHDQQAHYFCSWNLLGIDGKRVCWLVANLAIDDVALFCFHDFEAFWQPIKRVGILVAGHAGDAGQCTNGASNGFCPPMRYFHFSAING